MSELFLWPMPGPIFEMAQHLEKALILMDQPIKSLRKSNGKICTKYIKEQFGKSYTDQNKLNIVLDSMWLPILPRKWEFSPISLKVREYFTLWKRDSSELQSTVEMILPQIQVFGSFCLALLAPYATVCGVWISCRRGHMEKI